jgi:hypothetical protein
MHAQNIDGLWPEQWAFVEQAVLCSFKSQPAPRRDDTSAFLPVLRKWHQL